MELVDTPIEGLHEVRGLIGKDRRGLFVKTYREDLFEKRGLNTVWREQFWSTSSRGVLRGMHFQGPPADHAKLVACVHGVIWDVGVDLRRHSRTYGEHFATELSSECGKSLYLPRGVAHGFKSLSEGSVVCYAVETAHSPQLDMGVRWDSCGIEWPETDEPPVISERDAGFRALEDIESPF
jgi:dTDP-4-dehydrorhamnose 3,5-epimerase